MCYAGTKIERGPYRTIILRRHRGCVGNDVMAGGWCCELIVTLTSDERRECRDRDEKRELVEMKFVEAWHKR